MINNFIFDLYGTLVDVRTNEEKNYLWEKLSAFYGFYGAAYTPLQLKKAYKEEVEIELAKESNFAYPELDLEGVFQRLYTRKGVEVTKEHVVHTGQFFRILSTQCLKLYDASLEILEELKALGKNVYLLSNAQEMFTAYELKYLGLYDKFDGILLSSVEGCRKPDVQFFNLLLERYGIEKETSIMIGNDPTSDIEGAYQTGMRSVYICTDPNIGKGHRLHADYSIPDGDSYALKELLLKLAKEI